MDDQFEDDTFAPMDQNESQNRNQSATARRPAAIDYNRALVRYANQGLGKLPSRMSLMQVPSSGSLEMTNFSSN